MQPRCGRDGSITLPPLSAQIAAKCCYCGLNYESCEAGFPDTPWNDSPGTTDCSTLPSAGPGGVCADVPPFPPPHPPRPPQPPAAPPPPPWVCKLDPTGMIPKLGAMVAWVGLPAFGMKECVEDTSLLGMTGIKPDDSSEVLGVDTGLVGIDLSAKE